MLLEYQDYWIKIDNFVVRLFEPQIPRVLVDDIVPCLTHPGCGLQELWQGNVRKDNL